MKGEFENRLRQVIDEVQASPKPIILFIDEAHTLMGAGGAAGTGDAAQLLKPALARGTLRTVAATTQSEYKAHFEKDPAMSRRFQVVKVDEPDEIKCLKMIRGLANVMERHHKVQVLDEALDAAVRDRFADFDGAHHIIDQSRHSAMHETHSIDVICLLQGEVSLTLENGETRIRPGQVVIQRGTNHAWTAHGGPALLLAVLIDRPLKGH